MKPGDQQSFHGAFHPLINRPGVAGAVLQTASSLIKSVMHPFPPNLQDIINPKPLELEG